MPAWTVRSHGKAAIATVLKGLKAVRSDFVTSPYAPPRIDGANGVVWASFIIPGMQNPQAELYIEKFGDFVSMRLTGTNPNFVADTRKTAQREGEIPATANAVTRWLQSAARDFAKQLPHLRKEAMTKYPNAEKRIDEKMGESILDAVYYAAYYDRVGEHGNGRLFHNFKTALRDAERIANDPELNDDETWYIGVEASNAPEFAVVKMTPEYLKLVSQRGFGSQQDYQTWLKVANKALSSGRTVTGNFDVNTFKNISPATR